MKQASWQYASISELKDSCLSAETSKPCASARTCNNISQKKLSILKDNFYESHKMLHTNFTRLLHLYCMHHNLVLFFINE